MIASNAERPGWPAGERVADIDIPAVDDYRRFKAQQAEKRRKAIEQGRPLLDENGRVLRPLAPQTINKTISKLQGILALAVEYQLLPANPAAGKRRRMKAPAKRPVHLDSVQQIQGLLDAADLMDHDPHWLTNDRHAIISTLILAGPRVLELCLLQWRDVDLVNGRIYIGRSKTAAGLREIYLLPLLRTVLTAHRARYPDAGPDDPVFCTLPGKMRNPANIRNRTLGFALTRADALLAERGQSPLPIGVTPHKLRHTFASILVACGEDPASVMAQLGHTDPGFTLRVYTHLMRRDPAERARLKALVYNEPEVLASFESASVQPDVAGTSRLLLTV